MIVKKTIYTEGDWASLMNDMRKHGERTYACNVPKCPFVAVYDDAVSIKVFTFVSMDDFTHP